MSRERHARAREVFLEARDADAERREAILERDCADDPELRRYVEELLDHNNRMTGFLETPVDPQGLRQADLRRRSTARLCGSRGRDV